MNQPVNNQGSCAAYETAPFTVTEPDAGGSSPRMAWNKLDFPAPTVPITADGIYDCIILFLLVFSCLISNGDAN